MSDAIQKTKDLGRLFLAVEDLEPNLLNPNEMTDAEFNMLASNIEEMGITDAILVRSKKAEEVTPDKPAHYRIVGGHHRWEVAKLIGFTEVPCTVVTAEDFDEDKETFQVVRMNMIRGKISPDKFMKMYESMSKKYADEILAESFGFVEQEEFQKLIASVKSSLPKNLQVDFQKAAKELKTIDDLSKLLNRLFTSYGDTLPYGYMFLDFGGKESIWIRMDAPTKKAVYAFGKVCIDAHRTMDDLLGGLIQLVAEGHLQKELLQLIAASPAVIIPDTVELPTKETLSPTV